MPQSSGNFLERSTSIQDASKVIRFTFQGHYTKREQVQRHCGICRIRFGLVFVWPHVTFKPSLGASPLFSACVTDCPHSISLHYIPRCLSWHHCSVSTQIGLDRRGSRHSPYQPLLLARWCILTHASLSHVNSGNARPPGERTPFKATKRGLSEKILGGDALV